MVFPYLCASISFSSIIKFLILRYTTFWPEIIKLPTRNFTITFIAFSSSNATRSTRKGIQLLLHQGFYSSSSHGTLLKRYNRNCPHPARCKSFFTIRTKLWKYTTIKLTTSKANLIKLYQSKKPNSNFLIIFNPLPKKYFLAPILPSLPTVKQALEKRTLCLEVTGKISSTKISLIRNKWRILAKSKMIKTSPGLYQDQ